MKLANLDAKRGWEFSSEVVNRMGMMLPSDEGGSCFDHGKFRNDAP